MVIRSVELTDDEWEVNVTFSLELQVSAQFVFLQFGLLIYNLAAGYNSRATMRSLRPVLGVALTLSCILILDSRIGQLPPLGRFLDPFHGVWQNAVGSSIEGQVLKRLNDEVKVVFDERSVPHIFAKNGEDLYFIQGYLTARDRLWQMELQTHAAAGRLSEIFGERTIAFDLEQRRIGMTWAAERSLEEIWKDENSRMAAESYTKGVNAFISSLDANTLPLEYKLLDYHPEPWTALKCALLMKHMAKMLTGSERDLANTELKKHLGEELFNKLYPEQNRLADPIVPDFSAASPVSEPVQAFLDGGIWETVDPQPSYIGSNNWAVSGKRTASGHAILCNDPHLKLMLPSIWYEVQLNGPDINCYGISLPGAPGIIIGFNERVAWGVTNAGRDIKDYYAITFENHRRERYRHGDEWVKCDTRIERVAVRGGSTVIDTVRYTHHGPVAYFDSVSNRSLALRWMAHEPSNESKTFHALNRAAGYVDYKKAISHFTCPAQNFAYADVTDTIAIWQQGRFFNKPHGHGRFVLDGSDPSTFLSELIPSDHNPHMVNPKRGFVSSANQAPTDSSYPYYYTGVFEEFRNRTINDRLTKDTLATVESMMALQNSNHNLLAQEALPLMMGLLDTNDFQNRRSEMMALYTLLTWDYSNDRGIIGPTVFEVWWDEFNNLLWDELNDRKWNQADYYQYSWEEFGKTGKAYIDLRDKRFVYPTAKVTIDLLANEPQIRAVRPSLHHRQKGDGQRPCIRFVLLDCH
jgi:penicillin G amidase